MVGCSMRSSELTELVTGAEIESQGLRDYTIWYHMCISIIHTCVDEELHFFPILFLISIASIPLWRVREVLTWGLPRLCHWSVKIYIYNHIYIYIHVCIHISDWKPLLWAIPPEIPKARTALEGATGRITEAFIEGCYLLKLSTSHVSASLLNKYDACR